MCSVSVVLQHRPVSLQPENVPASPEAHRRHQKPRNQGAPRSEPLCAVMLVCLFNQLMLPTCVAFSHLELSVGMTSEGVDFHSVGNTLELQQTALIEALNLKAAIEYQLKNSEAGASCLRGTKTLNNKEKQRGHMRVGGGGSVVCWLNPTNVNSGCLTPM